MICCIVTFPYGIKGTGSPDENFFEGLKIVISTFYIAADAPPRPLKSCLIVRGELKCRLFIKILAINKYVTQTTYYEHFLSPFIDVAT